MLHTPVCVRGHRALRAGDAPGYDAIVVPRVDSVYRACPFLGIVNSAYCR